jgi:hypothetical protein
MQAISSRVYSQEEVDKHNSKNDKWVVIHDKVYDISKYVKDHPGGEEILMELGDRTEIFEDIGHSKDAKLKLKEFYIGDLKKKTEVEIKKSEEEKKAATRLKYERIAEDYKKRLLKHNAEVDKDVADMIELSKASKKFFSLAGEDKARLRNLLAIFGIISGELDRDFFEVFTFILYMSIVKSLLQGRYCTCTCTRCW